MQVCESSTLVIYSREGGMKWASNNNDRGSGAGGGPIARDPLLMLNLPEGDYHEHCNECSANAGTLSCMCLSRVNPIYGQNCPFGDCGRGRVPMSIALSICDGRRVSDSSFTGSLLNVEFVFKIYVTIVCV